MIIVTGANGFIGSALVWELNNHGLQDILAVDRVDLRRRPALLKAYKTTGFLNSDELLKVFQNETLNPKSVSWVIHMGACSDTTETNKEFLDQVNVLYSQHVWNWCTKHQVPLIYASSAATYGDGRKGFDDQTSPKELRALNLYGESKRIFDEWVLTQQKTPPLWYGIKFFNVYGPNESHKAAMASVVYKAVQQIQSTEKLKLFRSHHSDFADGHQMRDFVYIKDVTRWFWEIMSLQPQSGIYNMGYGTARTWLDLAQQVFASMGLKRQIEWIDMPPNVKDQYQYWTQAKMQRFFSLGVSEPQWPLELAVHDYVNNYLLSNRGL